MRIKAVNDIEILHVFRRLLWQIRRTAAAENHDVYAALPVSHIGETTHRNAFGKNLDAGRITAGKHRHQFLIGIGGNGQFNAAAEIAVAYDADSDFGHEKTP